MIEPGTQVGGFRVEGLVGRGGMASVYRAVQLRLQRTVALKVLSPALAADDQFVQRFQLEGVNAARLEHANIVPVYEAGEDRDHVFLAMRFIDGEAMSATVGRYRSGMAAEEAMPILADVSRALEYAHQMGFVHRDVKPGNVLIERTGHVYLSDFGLSKAIGVRGLTSTGQWMGTAEYMAPEQAQAGPIDYRADLYALACMAFECLTGDPPFLGDAPLAVMMAHASAEVPSATSRNLSLPPGCDAVFRRAMAKGPDERYLTALAFVEALQAAVEERRLNADAEPVDDIRRYTRPGTTFEPPPTVIGEAVPDWPTSAPPSSPPPRPAPSSPPPQYATEAQSDPGSSLFCPSCVGDVERDDIFCGTCGLRLMWCGTCGGPMVTDDRFCQHCGTPAR